MNLNSKSWEHFSHGADIGIRGRGKSITEAFEMAAIALTAIETELSLVCPEIEVDIEIEEEEIELLFFCFLNELVFQMDSKGMIFSKINLDIHEHRLYGRLFGEFLNLKKHHPVVEVKGATFTELKVKRDGYQWTAQCVVDV